MYQTDKCVVAQVLKVVVIINLIITDHSRMIQAFRFIEISKYDDGGQLTTRGQLMQGSSSLNFFYLCRDVRFIKYCKEMPGEIRDLISSHEY